MSSLTCECHTECYHCTQANIRSETETSLCRVCGERELREREPGRETRRDQPVTGPGPDSGARRVVTRFVVITCRSNPSSDLLALLWVLWRLRGRLTIIFPHVLAELFSKAAEGVTVATQYQIPSIGDLWGVKLKSDASLSNRRDNLNIKCG